MNGGRVIALEEGTTVGAAITAPMGLPSFASFAVSSPSEPVPPIAPGEEVLLSDAMIPAAREAFARGRAAAHASLRSIGLDDGPILRGRHREPLWPDGAVGSISHAAGYGVSLCAPSAATDGVGVDVEQVRHAPELWDFVPRAEEKAWIEELEPSERETALLALFSAKESIYKAFFPRVGVRFGFEQASLIPTGSGFNGRLVAGLDADYPPDRKFVITCNWFGDLVLTAAVLPKTPASENLYSEMEGTW